MPDTTQLCPAANLRMKRLQRRCPPTRWGQMPLGRWTQMCPLRRLAEPSEDTMNTKVTQHLAGTAAEASGETLHIAGRKTTHCGPKVYTFYCTINTPPYLPLPTTPRPTTARERSAMEGILPLAYTKNIDEIAFGIPYHALTFRVLETAQVSFLPAQGGTK